MIFVGAGHARDLRLVEHRGRAVWKASDATRLAGRRWVDALDANLGGTEMEDALVSTFALAHTGNCDVLLVTDGEISAIDATIAAAKASAHRLFVVGIGSSPAEMANHCCSTGHQRGRNRYSPPSSELDRLKP